MHSTTALVHPRAIPHYGRDGRPVWYAVEASDGTRLDVRAGVSVIAGRLDTDDGAPGQVSVHICTEGLAESDTYNGGAPKIAVSLNDATLYDDRGIGNKAEPVGLEIPIYVVQTGEGPYLFVDGDQAQAYADLGGHELVDEYVRIWDRAEGAQRLEEARESCGTLDDEEPAA